jgi:hypothetical protein
MKLPIVALLEEGGFHSILSLFGNISKYVDIFRSRI